jgi:excinuclease ABC subunit C
MSRSIGQSLVNSKIDDLKDRVRDFPDQSGVYLMKNSTDKIIYVGKAKNLKQRVRSYLGESKDLTPKTRLLVANIHVIDYILTKTEVEAFLLEASLIKKHRPKFNIRLKDDKNYPYIRVSMKDEYPRLYLSRTVKPDGSLYFGPYTRGGSVFETMRFLNQSFQLRDCTDHNLKTRERPCINFQLARCSAPCVKLVNTTNYGEDIAKALQFLRGQSQELIDELKQRMLHLSDEEKYEQAARWRDTLRSLTAILEKQSVVDPNAKKDVDIVCFVGDQRGTMIQFLHVRQGRVLGTRSQFLSGLDPQDPNEDPREWFVSVINQYFWENIVPEEVVLSFDIGVEMMRLMQKVLTERRGSEVLIKIGTHDEKEKELLELTLNNARVALEKQSEKVESKKKGLEEIKEKFNLPQIPFRIECYDISNFQGREIVASQVVFEKGIPAKDQYRLYKIKSLKDANDFASMKEVLSRRFKHQEWEDPQLVVVDGGKGQLNFALQALKEVGKDHLPLVSLAKAKTESDFEKTEVQGSEERFFLPGRQNPVLFRKNSEGLRILTHLRDEAHRFAITFHRKLRDKKSLGSILDEIEGVGEKRKKLLLERFSGLEAIMAATAEEIAALPSFNLDLAEEIKAFLMNELGDDSQP